MKQTAVFAMATIALALIGLAGAVVVDPPVFFGADISGENSYENLSGLALELDIPAFAAAWGCSTAEASIDDALIWKNGLPFADAGVNVAVTAKNTRVDPISKIDITVQSVAGLVNATATPDTHSLTLANLTETKFDGASIAMGKATTDVSGIRTAWSDAQFETFTTYDVGEFGLMESIDATAHAAGGAAAIADALGSFAI